MNIKGFFRRCLKGGEYARGMEVNSFQAHESFSQCGEDRIVAFLLKHLGIFQPTYLDVGANDPILLNNTYLFYSHGCRGVCVEANPRIYERLRHTRPRDTSINAAIGPANVDQMILHTFEELASGLTTLSTDWANQARDDGYRLERTDSVCVRQINDVLVEHCTGAPDFLSIDIEGLELEVLRTLDFSHFAPAVICAETFLRGETGMKSKNKPLIDYIAGQGYTAFADTYVNTIFVQKTRFPRL